MLKLLLSLTIFIFLTPLKVWGAGEVLFSSGQALRLSNQGSEVLRAGQKVFVGDQLQTGHNGFLYIRLEDEGLFILRPNSEGKIAAFSHNSQDVQKNEVKLDIQRGTARIVTGKVAKEGRDRFRLNTPVAAIGVRGTDFTVFTSDGLTRAAINSGSITVSNFNEQCTRNSLGPCFGKAALTLSEHDQLRIVEVRSDIPSPKLLDNEQLNPEKTAPKGPQEPKASTSSSENTLTLNKDPLLLENALNIEVPPDRSVNWGRWQRLAKLPPNIDLFKILRTDSVDLLALSSYFTIIRDQDSRPSLPNSGQISFNLKDQDAYFIAGNVAQIAKASNASLTMNFATLRFNTQLELSSANYHTSIIASGSLEKNGTFTSDPLSGSYVSGGLGGALNNEAAYLFQKRINDSLMIHGASYWSR